MTISITIPAFNEAGSIGTLLESICRATYGRPRLREVLVYDDGSSDATASIVEAQAARFPVIRLIRGDQRVGCAHAIQLLYERACGEAVVRVNADIVVCDGAIELLVDAIEQGAAIAIAANEPVRTRVSVPAIASAFSYRLVAMLKAGRYRHHYVVGQFVGYDRRFLEGLSFPADVSSEDHYTTLHVVKRGGSIVNVPEARCLLKPATTFNDYWRQSRRVLEGERQLRRRYGVESTPLSEIVRVVFASAMREPIGGLCWAVMYGLSSLRPSPARNSAWQVSKSTKGPIG